MPPDSLELPTVVLSQAGGVGYIYIDFPQDMNQLLEPGLSSFTIHATGGDLDNVNGYWSLATRYVVTFENIEEYEGPYTLDYVDDGLGDRFETLTGLQYENWTDLAITEP